jgi:hypothetical protein
MRPHAPWPQPAEEGSLRARVAFVVAVGGGAVCLGSLGVGAGLHFLGVPIPDRSPLQAFAAPAREETLQPCGTSSSSAWLACGRYSS